MVHKKRDPNLAKYLKGSMIERLAEERENC